MGSGSGSEGIRWSRYLPRALLTATRHRLSKALGTPGMRGKKGDGEKEVNSFLLRTEGSCGRQKPLHTHHCHCPNSGAKRAGEEGLVIRFACLWKEQNAHDLGHLLSVTASPRLFNSLARELGVTPESPCRYE